MVKNFKVGDRVVVKRSYGSCTFWYKKGEKLTINKVTSARGFVALSFKEYPGGLFALDEPNSSLTGPFAFSTDFVKLKKKSKA